MKFLNHIMNKLTVNTLRHERVLAALRASNNELSSLYSCEDAASQCFYTSFHMGA